MDAKQLKARRLALGLTQDQLGRLLHPAVTRDRVCSFERELRTLTPGMIARLELAFQAAERLARKRKRPPAATPAKEIAMPA